MNTVTDLKRVAGLDGRYFPICYFLLAALSFNSITAGRDYLKYIIIALMVYAAVRGLYQLVNVRRVWPIPLIWCCGAFFLSYLASTAFNYRYGITDNLKTIVWLGLCLFLLYPSGTYEAHDSRKRRKPMSYVFMDVLIAYTGVQAVISFGLLIARHASYRPVNIYMGFVYGRLWGSYADPNYGAMLSIASMIAAMMYIAYAPIHKIWKVLLNLHIILMYVYVAFSYSRGGMIVMSVASVLFYLYWSFSGKRTVMARILVGVLLVVLCTGVSSARAIYNWSIERVNQSIIEEKEAAGEEVSDDDLFDELNRDDASVEYEIKEGRLAIWDNGVDILKRNPVFGISYRNILSYQRAEMPDSYMVNHNEPLSTCHNALVDVAVSQGGLGLVILFVTVAWAGIWSLKRWKYLDRTQKDTAMTYGLTAVTILGGAMFLSDVFYLNSPTTVAFWYLFGQWMAVIGVDKQKA